MSTEDHELPEKVGRFQIEAELGRWALGRLLQAHDPVLSCDVVVATLDPEAAPVEQLGLVREALAREARVAAELQLPGMAEVLDYSEPSSDPAYVACERIDAPALDQVMATHGKLAPHVVAALGHELATILASVHGRGAAHGGVVPENITWIETGRLVLGGFGASRILAAAAPVAAGPTSSYTAPEQLQGSISDPRSDLYALGAILFEALWGHSVLDDAAGTSDELRALGDSEVPPPLEELILHLLRRRPEARPANAEAVVHILRDVLDGLDVVDAHSALLDFGDARADAATTGEDDEPPELFESDDSLRIRAPRTTGLLSRAAWRGPILFAMVGIGGILGAGAFMLARLGRLPDTGDIFPGATTERRLEITETQDVFVLLRFHGQASVWVDGKLMGAWTDQVRLALAPGVHVFEVRAAELAQRREVELQPDAEMVLDFRAE